MRMGKAPTRSPDSGNDPSGSVDGSVKRRQSFTSAVSAFAAELRVRPKKPVLALPRLGAARKSADNLSLANAGRSKSCSYLPATASDEPLLTLVLSSTSFLDTTISESGERLYVIDTKGARTNICREDPVQGVAHVGAVNWADDNDEDRPLGLRNSATMQMAHGRRYCAEEFLRRTKLTSSRLFNIPHYPHTLKWKRSGGNHKLMVSKGKATIAVLEPAMLAAPTRIKVFETLHEHDAARPQLEHRGVPVFLLDYMVATALLVVADKDEWLHAASGTASSASAHSAPFRLGGQGSIQRWRMDVRTEPFTSTEFGSRPSSPAVSSVIDIGPSKADVGSDCGADVGCKTPSPQLHASRISHLLTTSPESASSPGPSFTHSPALSVPVAVHPFASEINGGEDSASPTDDFGIRFSPLTCVLPPALGVSLGDSSPSPSSGPSPDSEPPRRRTLMRTWSAQSLVGAETPRQASKSLPATPTKRPSTAGSIPSVNSRPFRPLPRTPQTAATLPVTSNIHYDHVPPVPSLSPATQSAFVRESGNAPFSAGHDDGLSEMAARASGSHVVLLSSRTNSPSFSPSLVPGSSMAGSSRVSLSSKFELVDTSDERPRSIRRSASEATLSAKSSSEVSSEPSSHVNGSRSVSRSVRVEYDREHNHAHAHADDHDPSLLKSVHRRSIYKKPFSSPSAPAPNRTLSAPSVPILIPRTAPLRIRNTHTHNTGPGLRPSTSSSATSSTSSTPHLQTQAQSQSEIQTETQMQAPTQSRISHATRPSVYARPPPDDEEGKVGEEEGYECVAPPAYDSIDFSHPPLKQTGFRGLG